MDDLDLVQERSKAALQRHMLGNGTISTCFVCVLSLLILGTCCTIDHFHSDSLVCHSRKSTGVMDNIKTNPNTVDVSIYLRSWIVELKAMSPLS